MEQPLTQEELKTQSAANWDVYSQFQAACGEIVAQMRETPQHASEIPPEDDRHTLAKVELPEEGGILAYMKSEHNKELEVYPYKGFPFQEFVANIESVKKMVRGLASGLYLASPVRMVFALPAIKEFLFAGTYSVWRVVDRYRIKPHRYSTAVRELYRAFSVPQNDDARTKELRYMVRDIICMITEFDNAYRYRAQDVLGELREPSYKELNRLIDLASSRETGEVKNTWKLVKVFTLYLRYDTKLRDSIFNVLRNLDTEKFKLDEGDIVYCKGRKDYRVGALT